MLNRLAYFLFVLIMISCGQQPNRGSSKDGGGSLAEFSDYYQPAETNNMISGYVNDTFKIFRSLPKGYDAKKKYPLIIVLDANALYEPLIEELKFNTFIGSVPRSIVVGIGYSSFHKMDSVSSRDYTFPQALPEYEMAGSGGAEKFKAFIDKELLPSLLSQYGNIDIDRSVLCGHSLGGYFSLFYLLRSAGEGNFAIKNFVAASPALFYNNRYLFGMEKAISPAAISQPASLYISMGSEDMEEEQSKGILQAFEKQLQDKHYQGLKLKAAEYTNFGHFDAALPGLLKGLSFVLKK